MAELAPLSIALAAGYLVGSIPSGYLVVRRTAGSDLRRVGSGNVGATNAARAGGWRAGLATLVLDVGKGAAGAAAAAALLGVLAPGATESALAPGVVLLGPALGHCFSPWLRFRGGKAVATAFGALAAFDAALVPVPLGAFALGALATRRVSIGSLAAALALPASAAAAGRPAEELLALGALGALIVARHHANIRRLLRGAEPPFRFGATRPNDGAPGAQR